METILDILKKRSLVLDGAMGTTLMAQNYGNEIFGAHPNCFEYLVESAPEIIYAIHTAFLENGAEIIETDSFSGVPRLLAEHGLDKECEKLNEKAVALAKKAADFYTASTGIPRFVAASIGPGDKLPSLGQISYHELYSGYRRQIAGLISGGADLLQIETAQDLLQIKAAVAAAHDEQQESRQLPIYVSVTLEKSGNLLTGSPIPAIVSALWPLDIDILGFNCGAGPESLAPYLKELAAIWPKYIGFYPNAGLPLTTPSGLVYPENPEEMATHIGAIMDDIPLAVIGGCCGTSPEHIGAISKVVKGKAAKERLPVEPPVTISSLYGTVDLRELKGPLWVAERTNATGSKAFRKALLSGDLAAAMAILADQESAGADAADLSTAYAGLDEKSLLQELAARANRESRLPLVLDSTNLEALEAALMVYGGRALINSINLEDGGAKALKIIALAKKYGAMLIALTIDESGMAKTASEKLAVAARLITLAKENGLAAGDLFIDFLTFTLASGDEGLKSSAIETLNAIKELKKRYPEVHTILGLSNISFGLNPKSRPILNSLFLHEAAKAGLSAAIIHKSQIIPLSSLPEEAIQIGLNLIYNQAQDGDPLELFIKFFKDTSFVEAPLPVTLPPAESIRLAVLRGREELLKPMPELLNEKSAAAVLNDLLLPAMAEVGDLMSKGKTELPFVLKSAEVMSKATKMLEPYLAGTHATNGPKVILATVRGDVHDIGKNLVKMILTNNGIRVIDLGIKVPIERILEVAKEEKPDAIGLSGLLVSSAQAMIDYVKAFKEAGLTIPVLVGGAALTADFTQKALSPVYAGEVFYCQDAFDDLRYLKK